jgi:G6PDH family F420-dependent oxidoreductase
VRIEMLEEAIEVMRGLWEGGQYSHYGVHYAVENARIYTLPDSPPDILVSGFGPKSVDLAARAGDGYVTVGPDKESVDRFRSGGGGDKVVQGGTKVCWGPDEAECVQTVHRLWPNEALPGELAQILPQPAHFEQATELVSVEMIAESVPCGPDVERIVQTVQEFADAGFDELYVQQIGARQAEFVDMLSREVLPRFG